MYVHLHLPRRLVAQQQVRSSRASAQVLHLAWYRLHSRGSSQLQVEICRSGTEIGWL